MTYRYEHYDGTGGGGEEDGGPGGLGSDGRTEHG